MPHDPALIAETKDWLSRAAEDIRAGENGLSASPPLLADVVFHSQQAAEKALKAFLTWHSRPFRKTHSLEELGEQCLALDPTLVGLIDRAAPLTEYAWEFRYPGHQKEPAPEEAEEAMEVAKEVCGAVLERLPIVVRP